MSTYGYSGAGPGIFVTQEGSEADTWFGLHEHQVYQDIQIASTVTDLGNTPTTNLRPGLLLSKKRSDGKYYPWSPTAVDGTEVGPVVLTREVNILDAFGNALERQSRAIVAGNLKAASLIIPGAASVRGINGHANELMCRGALYPRYRLDDEPQGHPMGGFQRIIDLGVAGTGNAYTVLESDNNTLFVTDTIAADFTLTMISPTNAKGFRCMVAATCPTATLGLIVNAAGAAPNQFIGWNNASVDSITLNTDNEIIGAVLEFIVISATKILVIPHLWKPMNTGLQTVGLSA